MAHIKLANPRRALYSQVLLSNFMYSYLAKVQALHPQMQIPASQQQKAQHQQQSKDGQPAEYSQYQRWQEVSRAGYVSPIQFAADVYSSNKHTKKISPRQQAAPAPKLEQPPAHCSNEQLTTSNTTQALTCSTSHQRATTTEGALKSTRAALWAVITT